MVQTWTIDPADEAAIPASQLVGSQPSPKRGETGTWALKFNPDGFDESHLERYERLMAYQDWAGDYATGKDGNGHPWFREQHPGPSLLVALRPADWDTTGRGQWALIDAIDDAAEVPEKVAQVDIDLLYLAPLSEYDTARAARAMEADWI